MKIERRANFEVGTKSKTNQSEISPTTVSGFAGPTIEMLQHWHALSVESERMLMSLPIEDEETEVAKTKTLNSFRSLKAAIERRLVSKNASVPKVPKGGWQALPKIPLGHRWMEEFRADARAGGWTFNRYIKFLIVAGKIAHAEYEKRQTITPKPTTEPGFQLN